MESEKLNALIDSGYADEAGLAAEVASADGVKYLCVNGEVVTLAAGDPPVKVFSDSIDTTAKPTTLPLRAERTSWNTLNL